MLTNIQRVVLRGAMRKVYLCSFTVRAKMVFKSVI